MRNARAPKLEYSRPCPKCGHTLYRTLTGNIPDFRHQGAETQCPKPSVVYVQILPDTTELEKLLWKFGQTKEVSRDQYALDA